MHIPIRSHTSYFSTRSSSRPGRRLFRRCLPQLLAWIAIRTNAPFRKFFELTAIIPNIFPPVMLAVSWTVLLSPRTGLINRTLMDVFSLTEAPLNIYSLWGMIFVESLITTPLAFLIVSASLYSMDPSLEESARVAGSSNLQIAWRITFPIVRPAFLSAAMLNFVRAIESFDTPAIIALPARIEVFTTKIYREAIGAFPPNQNLAATYAVSLLLITMIFVYFYRYLTKRSERYVTVTGRGYRPTIIDLGKWRYPAAAIAGLILTLIVVLPFMVLIYVSFITYVHVPSAKTWDLLTLDNYRGNLSDARTYRALQNSLMLAIGGATLCMLLATLTAWVTTKTKTAGRGIIEALTFIPWAFPGTALAIGLLWTYVYVPLPIYGSLWILLIAYITRFLPYGLRTMTSTIVQLHDDSTTGVDGVWSRLWHDFPAHFAATFAPRLSRRLDHLSNDLSARVQHIGFSLFTGRRTAGTAALSLLCRRQLRADVLAGHHCQYNLHSADRHRATGRQSRRSIRGALILWTHRRQRE